MKRLELGVWVVIAIALVRIAFGPGWGEARAAGPTILCEAFYADQVGNLKQEKAIDSGRAYAATVKAWLDAHPGDPVFRSTLVNEGLGRTTLGYIDIVCVR